VFRVAAINLTGLSPRKQLIIMPLRDIRVVDSPLPLAPPDFSSDAGAVVDFYGVVRGLEGEMQISGIDYEAHGEMARHQLELIANEAGRRFSIQTVILLHRVGFVPVAEPSLFLRVSAERRRAAFDAAQWLIEELKARVPIWKHPVAA
jgi:molybdopterin synthase catalytic subunit